MTPEEFVEKRSVAGLGALPQPFWTSRIVDRGTHRIRHHITSYFRERRDSFPYDEVEELLRVLIERQPDYGLGHGFTRKPLRRLLQDLEPILDRWMEADGYFERRLEYALRATAIEALEATFDMWSDRLGVELRPTPEMRAVLAEWAEGRATELLTLIDEGTRNGLVDAIVDGLVSGRPLWLIMAGIRHLHLYELLGHDRPVAVAWVEAVSAIHRGVLEANRVLGATEKSWVSIPDHNLCEVCEENSCQGPIPIDQAFQSGHHYPPVHFRCRCDLEYSGIRLELLLEEPWLDAVT